MILIDTNVVSEPMKERPSEAVIGWLNEHDWGSLFLCTPVLAELHSGVERLADARCREILTAALDRMENDLYAGRILAFDQAAAANYGVVTVKRERQGRRMGQMDALIAAIAMSHGAMVATRDIADFMDLGIELINPFDRK